MVARTAKKMLSKLTRASCLDVRVKGRQIRQMTVTVMGKESWESEVGCGSGACTTTALVAAEIATEYEVGKERNGARLQPASRSRDCDAVQFDS